MICKWVEADAIVDAQSGHQLAGVTSKACSKMGEHGIGVDLFRNSDTASRSMFHGGSGTSLVLQSCGGKASSC